MSAAPISVPAPITAMFDGSTSTALNGTPVRGQVRLAWSNLPSSTTTLTVQRCKGATCTSFTQIAAVSTSTTGYIDSKVSPGTTYKYRLMASDGTASAPSNTTVVTARR